MAKRASTVTFAALGGAAIGLIVGWQLPDSPSAAPVIESATANSNVPPALAVGERERGEITSASELNGKDGSRFERFTLSLEEGALVEIELGGPLQGALALFDADETLLATSMTYDYYDTTSSGSLRRRIDESGDYLLVVSGIDAHSYGPFTLATREMEIFTGNTLTMPDQIDGWLQDGEDSFTLNIEESGLYEFEMRSNDIDAYLVLEGPNNYWREDDDSAGSLDARIADFLEPGEYRLTARTAYGHDSGLYTLKLGPHELASGETLRNSGALVLDEPLHGWFSGEGLSYQLELDTQSVVTLDMLSSDFDAYLELEGENVYASDDDGGEGLNARLVRSLAPGTYTVTARGYSSHGGGLFELSASAVTVDELPEDGTLNIGSTFQGWLDPGARDGYSFQIETAGHYRLDLISEAFDAYLELEGAGLSLRDDDSGGNLNARISTHLEPGTYHATARAYGSSESGSYLLQLQQD